MNILHLMGNTGAGKTSIMDALVARNPGACVGISVGRELRKKYPPEYFTGAAAPEHTEAEAMSLYRKFVQANRQCALIVIDGQPRKDSQVMPSLELWPGSHDFLLVHAPHNIRQERLIGRDSHDAAKMALAQARLDADYRNQYEVMVELARLGIHLEIVDSAKHDIQWVVERLEERYKL